MWLIVSSGWLLNLSAIWMEKEKQMLKVEITVKQYFTKITGWCWVACFMELICYIIMGNSFLPLRWCHNGHIASQITILTIVDSTFYSGPDQSKHQSSVSLAFVWGIHRGPVNSPHKCFQLDDVIMPCVWCWFLCNKQLTSCKVICCFHCIDINAYSFIYINFVDVFILDLFNQTWYHWNTISSYL